MMSLIPPPLFHPKYGLIYFERGKNWCILCNTNKCTRQKKTGEERDKERNKFKRFLIVQCLCANASASVSLKVSDSVSSSEIIIISVSVTKEFIKLT